MNRVKPEHENLKPTAETLKSECCAAEQRKEGGHQGKREGMGMEAPTISSQQVLSLPGFLMSQTNEITHTHTTKSIANFLLFPNKDNLFEAITITRCYHHHLTF